ncbi:Histone deacetylase complex subunit SAP18 [Heterocephalus glaber]|uniref:18 kDa Sin3-associated polypeptide n=1 Tax=Heterocephalus glaber TaxID=10181 RepID=G5C4Q6_HETGA|nr:Histone deacetylase complex subunit SAP18 [Heterocephalus glaber]
MLVKSHITQEEIKKETEKRIDLEKICSLLLLLRVFNTNNSHHHCLKNEFSQGNVLSSEQNYTRRDATLEELTSLVKQVYPGARKKGTHFNFTTVFNGS